MTTTRLPQRTSLICSTCGYGVARTPPPGACPMCRTEDAWVRHPRPQAETANR